MRTVLRAIADAEDVLANDSAATFDALQPVVSDATAKLNDQLVHSPKLALQISDEQTSLGKLVASADRLADVTKNFRDCYHGAIESDRAGDEAQKLGLRAFMQQALFDCATNISTSAEFVSVLNREWKAEVDVDHPAVATTGPSVFAAIAKSPPPAAPPLAAAEIQSKPVELLRTMQGNTERKENGVIVLHDPDKMNTEQAYVAPVKFTIVAITDSTDIRVGYAADQIIFNGHDDPTQLRIDGGPPNGRYIKGVGGIPVKRWVKIELLALPGSMQITVDSHERYRTDADFSHVNQPLSIFPAAGSTVRVKSVVVEIPADPTSSSENSHP